VSPAAVESRLPGWRQVAACRTDPDLFFGPDGEKPAAREMRERQAKAVCAGCPVWFPCQEFAVSHGVWAGRNEHELDHVRRNRRRNARRARYGRPSRAGQRRAAA
jgi:WhiB family transcriptional regulator, redox-sensing transcriptional regulator